MPKKRKKVVLSWSGGKKSAITLFELKSPEYNIAGLISVFDKEDKKLYHDDVPEELIDAQAASLGLPLFKVYVDRAANNETYEMELGKVLSQLKSDKKINAVAYGDLCLEDVKQYRESYLAGLDLEGVFPLWGWKPEFANQAFSGLNHQAIVHGINTKKVPPAFLGRAFNPSFVSDLPKGVGVASESGEFHSFVYDGPFFQQTVAVSGLERIERDGFTYLELGLSSHLNSGHNRVN